VVRSSAASDVYKRQVVERHLAKVNVEGSNPFTRLFTVKLQ
jgi:hypothetical protein